MYLSAIVALAQSADGGRLDSVVDTLPTDPASIFALLLILVASGAVLWFGRPRGGGDGKET